MRRADAQIIADILAGDPSGFRRLFERYVLAVEEVIARVWQIEHAEQAGLVEECFVQAFADLHALREPSRFDAYLLGLAHGVARQRLAVSRGAEASFVGKPNCDVSRLRSPGTKDEIRRSLMASLIALDPTTRALVQASCFGEQVRPQLLAARHSLEVATVGAAIERAWARFKIAVLVRLLDGQAMGNLAQADPSQAGEALSAHLTDDLYDAILRGEPVNVSPTFCRHMSAGCETCEAFLRARSASDALDGLIAAALFAEAHPASRRGHALFDRVLRRLKIDARLSGGRRAPMSVFTAQKQYFAPLLFAGLLGLAGIVVFAMRMTPSFQASLSDEVQRDLRIAFHLVEVAPDGSGEEEIVVEGVPGQTCPQSRQLVLSYHLLRSRFVAITRVLPDRTLELLELPGRRSPGSHVLSINGVPARVLLQNAVGVNRFAVVASDRPLDAEQLKSILSHLRNDRPEVDPDQFSDGTTLSWFELEVTDGAP